jgi:hypothetical protein
MEISPGWSVVCDTRGVREFSGKATHPGRVQGRLGNNSNGSLENHYSGFIGFRIGGLGSPPGPPRTLQGAVLGLNRFPGVRKERVPGAKVLARLRRASPEG